MKKLLLILSIWTFVLNAFASNNVELIDFNGYKAWEEKYSAESDLSVIHSKETAIYNTATKSFDALSLCTGDTKEYIVKLKENKRLQFLSLSSSGTASTQNEKSLKRMLKKYKSHKRIKTKKVFNKQKFTKLSKKKKKKLKNKLKFNTVFSNSQINRYGIDRVFTLNFSDLDCISINEIIKDLENNPAIDYIEPNAKVQLYSNPNDPFWNSNSENWAFSYPEMWAAKQINPEAAWDLGYKGEGIHVAIIDTGVDYNHPDLWDNIWIDPGVVNDRNEDLKVNLDDVDLNGNKFIEEDEIIPGMTGYNYISESHNPIDTHGHGTHIAGTIAAVANNNLGLIGISPDAKIIPIKTFTNFGGSFTDIANAIIDITDKFLNSAEINTLVINHSYGGRASNLLKDAFNYANDAGIINFVAAGNSSDDAANYSPANFDSVITVGSNTYDKKISSFSNYGASVDLSAPGGGDANNGREGNIVSTASKVSFILDQRPGSRMDPFGDDPYVYKRIAGTSMACPHALAAGVLLLSKNPNLAKDDLKNILANFVTPLSENPSAAYPKGIIDISQAILIDKAPPNIEALNLEDTIEGAVFTFTAKITATTNGAAASSATVELSSDSQTWSSPIPLTKDSDRFSSEIDLFPFPEGKIYFRVTVIDDEEQSSSKVFSSNYKNSFAIFPSPGDFLGNKADIEVKMTIPPSADSYTIERSSESMSGAWTSEGIIIPETVTDNLVATIPAEDLEADAMNIVRIRLNFSGNETIGEPITFYVDSKLKAGYPKLIKRENSNLIPLRQSTIDALIIENFDEDAELEELVHFVGYNLDEELRHELLFFDGNSNELWKKNFYVEQLKAFADDYDFDSTKEIYAFVLPENEIGEPFKPEFRIFNSAGEDILSSPIALKNESLSTSRYLGPFAFRLLDTDKDGKKELFSLDFSGGGVIHQYNLETGEIIKEVQLNKSLAAVRPLAFGNFDSDDDIELLYLDSDKFINAVDIDTGNSIENMPFESNLYNFFRNAHFSVADLDRDGIDEILVDGIECIPPFDKASECSRGRVSNFIIKTSDASIKKLEEGGKNSVIATNFDEYANLESVSLKHDQFTVFNSSGETLQKPSPKTSAKEIFWVWNSDTAISNDFNNDQKQDIAYVYGYLDGPAFTNFDYSESGGIYFYDIQTGAPIDMNPRQDSTQIFLPPKFPLRFSSNTFLASSASYPIIKDIDNDSKLELFTYRDLIASPHEVDNASSIANIKPWSAIYAWDLEIDKDSSKYNWHDYRYDSARSGRLKIENDTLAPEPGDLDRVIPSSPKITSIGYSHSQVTVYWSAGSDNATEPNKLSYRVYRDSNEIATVDNGILSYQDSNVTPSTTYTYNISTIDKVGNESQLSNTFTITTRPAPPSAPNPPPTTPSPPPTPPSPPPTPPSPPPAPPSPPPSNPQPEPDTEAPRATIITSSEIFNNGVRISWNPSSDNESQPTNIRYIVLRDGADITTIVNQTFYIDSTTSKGSSYLYSIIAIDEAENMSIPSPNFLVTVPAPPPPKTPEEIIQEQAEKEIEEIVDENQNGTLQINEIINIELEIRKNLFDIRRRGLSNQDFRFDFNNDQIVNFVDYNLFRNHLSINNPSYINFTKLLNLIDKNVNLSISQREFKRARKRYRRLERRYTRSGRIPSKFQTWDLNRDGAIDSQDTQYLQLIQINL